jgi:hypothetical protein
MLHKQVLKVALNVIEVSLVAEAHMIYGITEVESVILALHQHCDVVVGMGGDVEITWHPIDLKEPFEVASLLLVQLFAHSLFDGVSELVFLKGRFCAEYLALRVQSHLVQLAHHISLVCAHDVLDIQAQYVTRHEGEDDVYVDWDKVVTMRCVNHKLGMTLHLDIPLDFISCQPYEDDGANNGDDSATKCGLRQISRHLSENVKPSEAQPLILRHY